jgi:hypothetical protein
MSAQTVFESEAGAKSSERSARSSIDGAIGGLMAVIVAVTLFIVIHQKKWRSEGVDEDESRSDIGIDTVETMNAFNGSDHYVSQDNTDQILTGDLSLVVE